MPLARFQQSRLRPIDGQPTAYLYIAAVEVNVLNCRDEVRQDRSAPDVSTCKRNDHRRILAAPGNSLPDAD
jgi:hypothetical protein